MDLLDELVKRTEYQLKTIDEIYGIDKLSDMDYIGSLVMHTLPDLLLEIKYLKKEVEKLRNNSR